MIKYSKYCMSTVYDIHVLQIILDRGNASVCWNVVNHMEQRQVIWKTVMVNAGPSIHGIGVGM